MSSTFSSPVSLRLVILYLSAFGILLLNVPAVATLIVTCSVIKLSAAKTCADTIMLNKSMNK